MPSWTRRDRDMYEELREGYRERGTDGERAEEIAAPAAEPSARPPKERNQRPACEPRPKARR